MPTIGPIKRSDFIRNLKKLGFTGPYPGAKRAHMQRGAARVTIPNPHTGDMSVGLLRKILRDAGVTRDEWESL